MDAPLWEFHKLPSKIQCKAVLVRPYVLHVFLCRRIIKVFMYKSRGELSLLEPVCCKKQQKKVPGLWKRGLLKDLNDSKLIVYESK